MSTIPKNIPGAIAVDLGATSARFAAGWLEDGELKYEIIQQIPHEIFSQDGRLVWDFGKLLHFVKSAAEFGSTHFRRATLGIDAWGVDHGFIDQHGDLLQAPVAYRDPSHEVAFTDFAEHRDRLYAETGIQHQPFNTLYQLIARRTENPALVDRAHRWLLLPDLIGYLLTRHVNYELTEASTTQLMGLNNQWSDFAFELAGWPEPDISPSLPGYIGEYIAPNIRLAHVGSHDTASAVYGLGPFAPSEVFLNIGTWSLLGKVVDQPIVSEAAHSANFTNERCVDGRVRFLKNVPGFWVANRLHAELGIESSIPDWIATANVRVDERIDLDSPLLFNPDSMLHACREVGGITRELSAADWAGIAMQSLAEAVAGQIPTLQTLVGSPVNTIVIGGGASRSEVLRQLVAAKTGCEIRTGATEATVVGNLKFQLESAEYSAA